MAVSGLVFCCPREPKARYFRATGQYGLPKYWSARAGQHTAPILRAKRAYAKIVFSSPEAYTHLSSIFSISDYSSRVRCLPIQKDYLAKPPIEHFTIPITSWLIAAIRHSKNTSWLIIWAHSIWFWQVFPSLLYLIEHSSFQPLPTNFKSTCKELQWYHYAHRPTLVYENVFSTHMKIKFLNWTDL